MLSLEDVRQAVLKHGKNPRVHPNGFIQLDLEGGDEGSWLGTHQRGHSGGTVRLHVWNPPGVAVPRQDTVNEIHDHVFDMKSTVIKGFLVQRLYDFVVDIDNPPTHERWQAVYGQQGCRLQQTGDHGWLSIKWEFGIPAGTSYTQSAFTFHDTLTPYGCVVTVMQKQEIHDGDASVLVALGTEPDNSFDRATAMPEEEIMKAIWGALA